MVPRLHVCYVTSRKSICISCPGSANACSMMFSIDGKWYFKFLPKLMLSARLLHLFSMFFFIPDHQNILLSASIFVEPECLEESASTTGLFSLSGIAILYPANNKPDRSVISLETGKLFRELYLFVCCGHTSSVVINSDQPKLCVSEYVSQSWN